MEVVSEATVATRQLFLPKAGFEANYRDSDELARMLSGLRGTLLRNSGS
jgi:hypothetical protein